ncbi:MAG: Uma2 family endonuclease [Chloroflexota bacterium]
MVAAKVIKPITLEEFIEFALQPENSEREFEFIYGRIVEKMPGRTTNSFIAVQIDRKSFAFCEAHNLPSYVSIGDGAYIVGGHTVAPDFAYKTTPMIGDYPDPEPPLWAVEVISPTDKANDIRDKRKIYIEAGILLWEIYPLRREVDIYVPGQLVRTVDMDGVLDGGDVLPGFELPVKDLFPES